MDRSITRRLIGKSVRFGHWEGGRTYCSGIFVGIFRQVPMKYLPFLPFSMFLFLLQFGNSHVLL
ncbi:hypothetical protein HanOQP8_Chr02g0043491 [Helianthus annuus]|nr:hypothetical protein HanOQP8_Chr02g0043491 [Helianthus annuus]